MLDIKDRSLATHEDKEGDHALAAPRRTGTGPATSPMTIDIYSIPHRIKKPLDSRIVILVMDWLSERWVGLCMPLQINLDDCRGSFLHSRGASLLMVNEGEGIGDDCPKQCHCQGETRFRSNIKLFADI